MCAPMRAMTEFEKQFPEIAKKYFDLKFSEQPYVISHRAALEEERAQRRRIREEKEKKRAERAAARAAEEAEKEKEKLGNG